MSIGSWHGSRRSDAGHSKTWRDLGDVVDGFCRKTATTGSIVIGTAWSRIVGRQHQADIVISVPPGAQLGRPSKDVRPPIERVTANAIPRAQQYRHSDAEGKSVSVPDR